MDCESTAQKVLKDRVVLIKLDDVSLKGLPKVLRQKSYLDFSNEEQRKHYKTKLLKALRPRRETVERGDDERSDVEGSGDEERSDEEESGDEECESMENIPLNEISDDGKHVSI